MTSDWHISHSIPSGHAHTRDTHYAAMSAMIRATLKKCYEYGPTGIVNPEKTIPLVIAGDIFDTWNEPAETINMVAELFGDYYDVPVFVIPGQHDLPNHKYSEIRRSALWTMVDAANGIRHSPATRSTPVASVRIDAQNAELKHNWYIRSAGWGRELDLPYTGPIELRKKHGAKYLLAAHKYIHTGGDTSYYGVETPMCQLDFKLNESLNGYSAAVFGDNHSRFMTKSSDGHCLIYNHGVGYPRKSNERSARFGYGILWDDGFIEHKFIEEGDKWIDWKDGESEYVGPIAPEDTSECWSEFMAAAKELKKDETIDFRSICLKLLGSSKLSKAAKRQIVELLPDNIDG